MAPRRALTQSIGALLFVFPTMLHAGPLADFEKAATDETDTPRTTTESGKDRESDDPDSSLTLFLLEAFGDIVSYGARLSLARVQPSDDHPEVSRRDAGSPDLPFIRLDRNYGSVQSDIDAWGGRIEVGYGPVGVQYQRTHFEHPSTQESLSISYLHGLYRVSGSSVFELDLGIGQIELEGEGTNTGLSMTLPISIYLHPNVGIRIAPIWSSINNNEIDDYDASISYVRRYFSFALGYRETRSHLEKLHGPYVGMSYYY